MCLSYVGTEGRLVVLDQSPQMLLLAKRLLGVAPNVEYALCGIPPKDGEDLDLEGKTFQLIVLHQLLPAVSSDKDSLDSIARWCWNYLDPGGTLALTGLNTDGRAAQESE